MSRERNEAEMFAAAVDSLLEPTNLVERSATGDPLLEMAKRLRQTASPTLNDPGCRDSLRQRLLASPGAAGPAAGRYAVLDTAIGRLHIAYRGRVVCGVSLASDDLRFEQQCLARYGRRFSREAEPP